MLSNAGASAQCPAAPRPSSDTTQCGVTAQFLEEQMSSAENFTERRTLARAQSDFARAMKAKIRYFFSEMVKCDL